MALVERWTTMANNFTDSQSVTQKKYSVLAKQWTYSKLDVVI